MWTQFENAAKQLGPNNITLQGVKGHVTEEMVVKGEASRADKIGNDGADELARQGRDSHPVDEQIREGIKTRQKITMIVQTMMIEIAMERAKQRREKEQE